MNRRLLYLGDLSGTSLHRANAFVRLGFEVMHLSPRQFLPASRWVDRIEWHASPRILSGIVRRRVLQEIGSAEFGVTWVDSGSLVSRELLEALKLRSSFVVNFNHDDPFGSRDGARFSEYLRALPAYDLVVVVRAPNLAEAARYGAKDVLYVFRTADEIAHAPRRIDPEIQSAWSSEVSFVGTWMPERGPFLARLAQLGVPLSIFGSGWSKAPEWDVLRPLHRKDHLDGDDYAHAIQCSKVSLGLLSKGNRDLHTTRSLEIPMLGGLLCAERTTDHLEMYVENEEAVFWRDADECAEQCFRLLANSNFAAAVALAGHKRVMSSGNTSEGLIRRVLGHLGVSST